MSCSCLFFYFNKHDVGLVLNFEGNNLNWPSQISAVEGCHRSGIVWRKGSLIFTDRICPRKRDPGWIKYSGNPARKMEMDSRDPVWSIQMDCILHYTPTSIIMLLYMVTRFMKNVNLKAFLTARILFRLTFAIWCNDIEWKLPVPLPGALLFVFSSRLLSPKTSKSPQKQKPLQRWDHGFPGRKSQRTDG